MVFKSSDTSYSETRQGAPPTQQQREAAQAAARKAAQIEQDRATSMTMFEYMNAAASTAVYPENGQGSVRALAYVFALLAEEAGEANGKWAKFLRDGGDMFVTREQIIAELGDVLWAVANIANEIDVSLSEVARKNVEKLASRQQRGVLGGSGDNR
jgi:NTP pyrophosphatase (non-canonical NTP hydrolase)